MDADRVVRSRQRRPVLRAAVLAVAGAAACAPEATVPREPVLPPPPRVETVHIPSPLPTRETRPPAGFPQDQGPLITFNAQNADVRRLLPLLAEAAGVSLVLGSEVQGTVSVYFRDVPAREALQIVLEEAGLSATTGHLEPAFGPAVFYHAPINVDEANAEAIRERFGVSGEMAEWIVRARIE